MSASEFAFLAIGLVLGVASGAALIEVLRARPPMAREVRVTVAPNAIHSRMASTLADPHGIGDPVGPARGGPGDRRWYDEIPAAGEPGATGSRVDGGRSDPQRSDPQRRDPPDRSGTPVRSHLSTTAAATFPAAAAAASRVAVPSAARVAPEAGPAPVVRPSPLWLRPTSEPSSRLVAVPMSLEPDPITTALRATAAASAVAAMAAMASAGPDATSSAVAMSGTRRRAALADAGSGATTDPIDPTGDAGSGASAAPGTVVASTPDGPCAGERRVAEERCAVALRARAGATAAADSVRRAQRTYDDLESRAEAAAATADPRSVRTAKEQAQQRFRDARTNARTRDDVEAGARTWLAEINRINHATREALLAIERDRSAAAALGPNVERLSVEADAARISAERADEACIVAREAVATCDEARALEDAADRSAGAEDDDGAGRIAAATPDPEDELALSTPMNSQAGQDALILRILRGDREAMQRAVARLSGDDAEARHRWHTQLGALAEALIARSIEASAFDFPLEHAFWGPFTQSQNRDIAAGLSSLGFRFDGFGDWVDERVPSQRDLSLAVGYAGLDPMRVRHWPTEAETRDLLRDVRVAADEYVAGAAGGLTLGELVTLLGRRADGLTELWNQWGSVRPILLEAS